jgi:nucleotide-binding universal stress UspA family protein
MRPAQERLLNVLTQDENAARLPPPTEPAAPTSRHRKSRVVEDLLVALDGKESGWRALDQALEVARREDARVLGLHVASSRAEHANEQREALQAQFDQRCRDAGIAGQIAIDVGNTAETLCKRARWSDLVVTGLAPPATGGLRTRLGPQFRNLIRNCPRPVLLVPPASSALQSALLAYDGGSKSEEALYVASYLANHWSLDLTLVTVSDSVSRASKIQTPARSYLEQHGIEAEMLALGKAPVAQTILHTADRLASDMILMGGYGLSPMVEAVLGNAVDEVLCKSQRPVLVLT